MGRVKLGLIGMGLIGTPHTRTLQRVEEFDLVAIADIDEKHAQTAATLGAKYYRDYEAMIRKESLQGVIIATPNHLHVSMGITAPSKAFISSLKNPSPKTSPRPIASLKQRKKTRRLSWWGINGGSTRSLRKRVKSSGEASWANWSEPPSPGHC